ncbi:MAG TPA: hypothetical protein VK790_05010 [Solirubrobacteraceae bacterium]|nr:hypothetical protein [Solirubrobacteraceae bacterium]
MGALALALAGCATASPQMGAATFLDEHGTSAQRVALEARAVELMAGQLRTPATRPALGLLGSRAARARADLARASRWAVAGQGEEGAEEEDVPRAETQVTEGAGELASAMSALQSYSRAPSAAALARYRGRLAQERAQWNEGIAQLWHLAHRSSPPTV